MLFIQLFFLLATIGSYVSEAKPYVYEKPTDKCDASDPYSTLPDGSKTAKEGTYDCNRYWLCMKMPDGSYDWVLEKCMGNLHYDGKVCSVGTTPSTGCVRTTEGPSTTPHTPRPTPSTPSPSTCNKKTLYTTKAATTTDPKDTNHYFVCMKSSSGGYAWVYEKCMGKLVYQDGTCEVSTTSKKPSVTLAYNP